MQRMIMLHYFKRTEGEWGEGLGVGVGGVNN